MADLKTDYRDDILDTSVNTQRKYRMINNDDGTVSFEDVTEYLQVGDSFGSGDINSITTKLTAGVLDTMEEVEANTQENMIAGALSVKELKDTLQSAINSKVTNSFTANTVPYANNNGNLVSSVVTSQELARLSGVTSSVQSQLDQKVLNNFTASRALATNSNGKVIVSAVTSTELGYLDGVTSGIQTQLDNKSGLLAVVTSTEVKTFNHVEGGEYVAITPTVPTKSGYTKLCCLGASTSSTQNLNIMSMNHSNGVCRIWNEIGLTNQDVTLTFYWLFVKS